MPTSTPGPARRSCLFELQYSTIRDALTTEGEPSWGQSSIWSRPPSQAPATCTRAPVRSPSGGSRQGAARLRHREDRVADVVDGDQHHQRDQQDYPDEVNQAFLLGADPGSPDRLDDHEQNAATVEGR